MWQNRIFAAFSVGGKVLFDDNGITTDGIIVLAVLGVAVLAVAVMFLLDAVCKKKGQNSEAKKTVAEIVKQISGEDKVTPAYAKWMTVDGDYKAGKRITRYWWYAIGFNRERIYIAPISISGKNGKVSYKNSFCVERTQLGLVNGKKNGNWMELYDKQKQKICTLKVEASNTNSMLGSDSINITQPEAAKAWKEQINLWLDVVNGANDVKSTGFYNNSKAADLKGQYGDPENKGSAKNV